MTRRPGPTATATATAAAAVAIALVVGLVGCGGDDEPDRPDPTTTSTTIGAEPGGPTADSTRAEPDGYEIDDAVLRAAVDQAEGLYQGVDDADDDDYRVMFLQACAEVRSGAASARPAAATAEAIAVGVPEGPEDRRFPAAAILATEIYLAGSGCGIDAAYPAAVREALHPLANEAFLEAAGSG